MSPTNHVSSPFQMGLKQKVLARSRDTGDGRHHRQPTYYLIDAVTRQVWVPELLNGYAYEDKQESHCHDPLSMSARLTETQIKIKKGGG